MRLGVRVRQGYQSLLDRKMRCLSTTNLEFDGIWGFIGKKQKHVRPEDNPALGDVWTFCAQHVTVLHLEKITPPLLAVGAAIVQEFRENAATEEN